MFTRYCCVIAVLAFCLRYGSASDRGLSNRIDSYLSPYVASGNFSGSVLVSKNGNILFEKAYGLADREQKVQNQKTTKLHVASVSMQFTATAVLRLIDKGALRLDDTVSGYIAGIPGMEKITIRDLLTQRSGLPDINSFPDYADVLAAHQSPASLIAKLQGHPLLFEPGTKFLHEEHSAYNLLALIIEKKTGLDFHHAMDQLLFQPAGMTSSGVDDDSLPKAEMALGYEPEGVSGIKSAKQIHWSAKAGNGSAYTTADNMARFVDRLFHGRLVSDSSLKAVLDTLPRVGYGWFRAPNQRFDQLAYYMNGRAPGYASFVLYLPREQLTVVALSNTYSSATTSIGYDVAAISLSLPYTPFHPMSSSASVAEISSSTGDFQFGPDFYQANAVLTVSGKDGELSLRWPDESLSPLIPTDRDHFIDRSYWEKVVIERDKNGRPQQLAYGEFHGRAVDRRP